MAHPGWVRLAVAVRQGRRAVGCDDPVWIAPNEKMGRRLLRLLSSRAHIVVGDSAAQRLRELAPVSGVVDLRGHETVVHEWATTLIALRPKGRYVVPSFSSAEASKLAEWSEQIPPPHSPRLASLVDRVSVGLRTVAITKRGRDHVAVSHREADLLLPRREPSLSVTVVAERSAGVYDHAATVTNFDGGHDIRRLDSTFAYPRQ